MPLVIQEVVKFYCHSLDFLLPCDLFPTLIDILILTGYIVFHTDMQCLTQSLLLGICLFLFFVIINSTVVTILCTEYFLRADSFFKFIYWSNLYAQHGDWTQDPKIKSGNWANQVPQSRFLKMELWVMLIKTYDSYFDSYSYFYSAMQKGWSVWYCTSLLCIILYNY